jgi:hypothetical protein
MQLLYNSDSFAVVQIELPALETATESRSQDGFEIVDKLARREIYLQGELARSFQRGVQALVDAESDAGVSAEVMDDFISGWTIMAQQPLVLH